jgi:hypothetical protein
MTELTVHVGSGRIAIQWKVGCKALGVASFIALYFLQNRLVLGTLETWMIDRINRC